MIDRLHEHFVSDDVVRRAVATGVARDYVSDLPDALSRFVMEANEDQFAIMYPLVQTHADEYVKLVEAELQKSVDSVSDPDEKKTLGRRQANAAVCLMRLQQPESVWPLLEHQPDPRSRSWFDQESCPVGCAARVIDRPLRKRSRHFKPPCIAACHRKLRPQPDRKGVTRTDHRTLQNAARSEPDAGLRSAALWLLSKLEYFC